MEIDISQIITWIGGGRVKSGKLEKNQLINIFNIYSEDFCICSRTD